MVTFATEFPVKPTFRRGTLIAAVVSWLRGTNYSTVLDDRRDADVEGETAFLRSQTNEELRIRELLGEGSTQALGFRHDFPDERGRLWRTEAVLRTDGTTDGQGLLRLRTLCIARAPGAQLETPRKPFLVKLILRDDWGGKDGLIDVSDQPLWLHESDEDIGLARDITRGGATRHLPVVYISASGPSQWLLSRAEIEKLAYDLGGVAHVVVEPTRSFSFLLRDKTSGKNAYGGTLGIALPRQGIIRRLHLGWQIEDSFGLVSATKEVTLAARSQMPSEGWDWTELQEQALRRQRERDRKRLTAEESEQLYIEEIRNLKDRIKQLEEDINSKPLPEVSFTDDDQILPAALVARIGPEIYPGEFSDRLRLAAQLVRGKAEQIGLDRRSTAVLGAVVASLPKSPGLHELLEDLKRATKDPKRVASELANLLLRHGYRVKSENKHIRLEAKDGYAGLDSITLPKTPSENRGLTNLRKQIERTLGISQMPD